MENYELDENGFKKSKLSLDDLDKYDFNKLGAIDGGKTTGNIHYQNGTGIFSLSAEERASASRKAAAKAMITNKTNGTSVYGMTFEERSIRGKKANQTNKNNGTALYGMSSEEKAKAAKKRVTAALNSGNHNSFKLKESAIKKYDSLFDLVPDEFTNKILAKILEENNIKSHNIASCKKYWLDDYKIKCIHEGKHGSNTDVSIYKKIVK